jgi:purine-binding chemotaxis protein CheW
MVNPGNLLVFSSHQVRLAIDITPVEQIIRAVKVSLVPNAPSIVLGVIDLHGAVIPVISLRARLNLPLKPVRVTDRFIILNIPGRRFAIVADDVSDTEPYAEGDFVHVNEIVAGTEINGVMKRGDGVVLIYDVGKFFPLSDAAAMAKLLSTTAGK